MSARSASRLFTRRFVRGSSTVVAFAVGTGLVYQWTASTNAITSVQAPQSLASHAPTFPKIKTRAEQLAEIQTRSSSPALPLSAPSPSPSDAHRDTGNSIGEQEPYYDLLVIGGGATGTGIALDAATRGLRVALVERGDFASGTSSKSTKLVHGGVRYLEAALKNFDVAQFELVREALRERSAFLSAAPHLVKPLPILLPVSNWWQVPYFWVGSKAYELLAGRKSIASSYYLSRAKAIEEFPLLRKDSLVGAIVYYDGQQNDARMGLSLALTASLYGANVVNYVDVVALDKDSNGKIRGARVKDLLADTDETVGDGKEFVIRAKGVINATGPFCDAITTMDDPTTKTMVAPSSGAHIILPAKFGPKKMGFLDPATSDGRVVFVLPWEGKVLAGTTESACEIEQDPIAKDDAIDFILGEVRHFLPPEVKLSKEDVLASWSGIRPLIRDPNAKNTAALVRSHLVTTSPSGLLTCAGGKWTTYRQMAQDAVDVAVDTFDLKPGKPSAGDVSGMGLPSDLDLNPSLIGTCQTLHTRMLGAHGYSTELAGRLSQHYGLDADIADHLTANYGDRAWSVAELQQRNASRTARLLPNYPIIEAEIQYAIETEMTQTAADFLARRTRLAYIDAEAAVASLPKVIDILAAHQGWTESRAAFEWRESLHFLRSMGLSDEFAALSREEVEAGAIERLQSGKRRLRENTTASNERSRDDVFIGKVPGIPLPAAAFSASQA